MANRERPEVEMAQGPNAVRLRLADILAALSVATDLGHGQSPETAMRVCVVATRLADRLGLSATERSSCLFRLAAPSHWLHGLCPRRGSAVCRRGNRCPRRRGNRRPCESPRDHCFHHLEYRLASWASRQSRGCGQGSCSRSARNDGAGGIELRSRINVGAAPQPPPMQSKPR
jgi:hypothetical protein